MTSWQHQDWINHGRPDSGLALPLQRLASTLTAAGYLVYTFPNDAHLDAEPPEDHAYYSETGWPDVSPKWWRHAIDVMPSKGGADLYALGQRIVSDRNAGQATWIKYINVPTSGALTGAVQHSWKPAHSQSSSSDTGHIHLSSITGCETLDSTYNPLTPVASAFTGGNEMALTDQQWTDMYAWLADLADQNFGQPGRSRFGWAPPGLAVMHGKVDSIKTTVTTSAAQTTALTTVVQALSDHINSGGGSVDVAAILAGVDARLAALQAETRDAVADLGEGGAAQVRADA